MHQVTTSSQIAAQAAATLAAIGGFGTAGYRDFVQPCSVQPSAQDPVFLSGSYFQSATPPLVTASHFPRAKLFEDSASRAYSLSPLSGDDQTSAGGAGGADAPPPGGAGDGDGDGSGAPQDLVGADIAYYALVRIADPTSNNVQLTEPGLKEALTFNGIIDWIDEEKRAAMKATARELSDIGERLARVERAIADRTAELAVLEKSINSRFNRLLSFFCEKIISLTSFISKVVLPTSLISKIRFLPSLLRKIGSISSPFQGYVHRREAKREQFKDIEGELAAMRKIRRELAGKADHKRILDEWMSRMARCADNYYVLLTEKGVAVLKRMREMGEPELKKMNFVYFMKQFEG